MPINIVSAGVCGGTKGGCAHLQAIPGVVEKVSGGSNYQ